MSAIDNKPAASNPSAALPADDRFRLMIESIRDYAIFMLDPTGVVVTWNIGAEFVTGYTAAEIIGQSFSRFYTPEAVNSGWPQEELVRARRDGRFEDEGWRVRKDGTRYWSNVIISALYRGGELCGFAKVTRDLSERRRHEEALRQSDEVFRLLVESVKDYAIFMLDPQGRIQSWNAGAARIKGYSASEVLGRHFSIFYGAEDLQDGKPQRELKLALRDGRLEDEGWRLRKDGSVFWANVVITPVHDATGALRGFAKVTRDMSDRRRLSELESSSRRMSEFLAMLAHELRNPLSPIRNAVSIMQLEPDLKPGISRCRDIIDRQLSYLTRLVDDLLDVGRIATGKILLKKQKTNYRDVVLRSVEAVRPAMDSRRHRLTVELPADPIEMFGDDTRLVQALQNLLINAAKYTNDAGRIRLQVGVEDRMVVTSVSDNGCGISAEALERIFELFVQEGTDPLRSESGLGIGLTLARTLVQLHGGMLTAQSPGPGHGSTFTIRLPLARPPQRNVADEGVRDAAVQPTCRTLVVDDNRDSADTMVSVLCLLGHDARAAYGADEALQIAQAFRPQAVLLDLNMPDGDGFSVLRRLQAQPVLAPIYVAAMTGHGQAADRERTLAAGFQAHLTKPVAVDALREVLRQAVASDINAGS